LGDHHDDMKETRSMNYVVNNLIINNNNNLLLIRRKLAFEYDQMRLTAKITPQ